MKLILALTIVIGLAAAAGPAAAVDRYWDGGGFDGQWGTGANWRQLGVDDNVLPLAGDNVFLDHTFVGGAYGVTQAMNPMNTINNLTVDPRAGAFAAGNITVTIDRNLNTTGTLTVNPEAGLTVAFDWIRNSQNLRVDTAINIGIGYVPAGGTVTFESNATHRAQYNFNGVIGVPMNVGPNLAVSLRLANFAPGTTTADCWLSWLRIGAGTAFTVNCTNQGGAGSANEPAAPTTNDHYIRLTATDGAFPNRALVLDAGSTLTVDSVGDDITRVAIENANSVVTIGDNDGAAENVTVAGTGRFVVFNSTTFQREAGGIDNATFSVGTFWLQMPAAGTLLTFADDLSVSFTGGVFQHWFGSIRFGTTAGNDGAISIAGLSYGAANQWIPADNTTTNVTHTITLNGAGTLSYLSGVHVYGNGFGGGGQGRIVVNDTGTLNLTDAGAEEAKCVGSSVAAPNNLPGEIVLNGTATLNVAGFMNLDSNTTSGGNLLVDADAIANVTGNLGLNLSATAAHIGGTASVLSTGRLWVGGGLSIQGDSTPGTTGGKILVSSTRASPGALSVTGATSLTAGSVSRGELTITTDSLLTFTGAVTVGDNGGAAQDALLDVTDTTGTGPTINFDGNVTVDGVFNPTANARSRVVLRGAGAQAFGGTSGSIVFDKLRFDSSAARTISFSTTDASLSVGGDLSTTGAGTITVASTGGTLRTFLAAATIDFGNAVSFSNDTALELSGAGDQAMGGSAGTDPVFRNFSTSGSGTKTTNFATMTVNEDLTVGVGTTLRLGSGKALAIGLDPGSFPPNRHTVSGTLELVAGTPGNGVTTVRFRNRQQLVVESTGTFRIVASDSFSFPTSRYVLFTRDAAGDAYSIHCRNGSTVDLQFAKFEYLYGRTSADEFLSGDIESALTISTPSVTAFHSLWFDRAVDTGTGGSGNRFPRYLYLYTDFNDIRGDETGEPSLNGMGSLSVLRKIRFDNTNGLPDLANVEKRSPNDDVTFTNCAGDLAPTTAIADDNDMDEDRGARDTGIDDIFWQAVPTAVALADLRATGRDRAVLIEWTTSQEVDNLGFNLYRSTDPETGFVRLNGGLVLGLGDSLSGGRYAFVDRSVENSRRYWYRLEDVDVRGERSIHGPVDAAPTAGDPLGELDPSRYVSVEGTDPAVRRSEPGTPGGGPAPGHGPRSSPGVPEGVMVGSGLEAAGVRVLSWDASGAVIEVLPPAPVSIPEAREGRLETRLEIAGYRTRSLPGEPEVPVLALLLLAPDGTAAASGRILEVRSRTIPGILPVRAPLALPAPPPPAAAGPGPADLPGSIEEARRELARQVAEWRRELLEAQRRGRALLLGLPDPTRRSAGASGPARGAGSGAAAGSYPGSLLEVGRVQSQADRLLVPLSFLPVQIQGGGAEVFGRILARIDFFEEEGALPPEPVASDLASDTPDQARLAADPGAVKVVVSRDRLYRLTRRDLAAAGFDVAADPRTFRLFHLGREVAIWIEGERDGSFDDGDEILFYGRRNPLRAIDNPEATPYTDRNVYWLAAGPGRGRRMDAIWARPGAGASEPDHEAVVHVEENRLFFPRLAGGEGRDHWFGPARIYAVRGGAAATARFVLATPFLSARPHAARLEIALAGVSEYPAVPDHRVVVSLGGQELGEIVWDGRLAAHGSFDVPSALLVPGDNALELRSRADLPGVSADSVLFNYARLTYRRRPVAEGDSIRFEAPRGRRHEISGFSTDAVLAVDVADPSSPRLLLGLEAGDGKVAFRDPGSAQRTGRYQVLAPSGIAAPDAISRNLPSTWKDSSHGADWIAVGPRSLSPGVDALARHRAGQGLRTAVVAIEDVYDEFTGGVPDPVALRAFFARALGAWERPRPRFALLVGDGTHDSHGYLGEPRELVPVAMVQTETLWTASDAWYAAVVGADDVPDLALGRFPVEDAAGLDAMVAKILATEGAGRDEPWRRRVTLVADNDDAAYDFTRATRDYAALVPAGYEVESVLLGERGAARSQADVLAAFRNGRLLVGYMGHGDTVRWASETLLYAPWIRGLGAQRAYPLVTALGCLNGAFYLGATETLGEALARAPSNGAVAFWGSTSLAAAAGQEEVYREILPRLLGRPDLRLGEAIVEAELAAWAGSSVDTDVIRTWVLLGDPATRLAGE